MPDQPEVGVVPSLMLIDASSYLYRAYHALPALTAPNGQPTGAIYGVVTMIKKLLADHPCDYLAAVFDAKGKTFRHEMAPFYKANRPKMPEDLMAQVAPLHAIIQAMGIPLLVVDHVEADDVIGTLAKQAESTGIHVLISTGDKDLTQLVTPQVHCINTMTDVRYDCQGVKNKWGVWPHQMVDYLTLVGDSSDNIPGVPKVGPKTAAKWLHQYGSLDGLLAHQAEISGKLGEALRDFIPQIPLSQRLVTIQCHLDLSIKITDLTPKVPDDTVLHQYFTELGFKTWLPQSQPTVPCNHRLITHESALTSWVAQLKAEDSVALEIKTTEASQWVGIALAISSEAVYIPLAHEAPDIQQCPVSTVISVLRPVLSDPKKLIIGYNLKSVLHVLEHHGLSVTAPCFDIMLAAYVLEGNRVSQSLAACARQYLHHDLMQGVGQGKKQLKFHQTDIETALIYAAEAADITLKVYQKLVEIMAKNSVAKHLFDAVEMPLMQVLLVMERTGVLIDADQLRQQTQELTQKMTALEDTIYGLAGSVFNLNSPKQLQAILFEKNQLPVIELTSKGQPSTSEAVLQALAPHYALPRYLLAYRSCHKLRSTYTEPLPEKINPHTGRLHCSYNQAVTATGRLSSTHPNLQNIPIKTEQGRYIRRAFIAKPTYQIIAADYAQIELRIMAHLSQDPGLLEAFKQDIDVHRATAADIFSVPQEAVTETQRRHAKAVNFGLIYGMSVFGLSKQLGVSHEQARQYMDQYFRHYPGIKDYMESAKAKAHEQGYVETLMGRRFFIPDIHSKSRQKRHAAERSAINAPIQGTSADIIKVAMIHIQHWLTTENIDAQMVMQVHDELVFEANKSVLSRIIPQCRLLMSHAMHLSVPLVVHIGVGDHWDEAHG